MSLTCLDTLVGLSARDCPCLSGGEPSGGSVSDSGYYLTDSEYGFPLVESVFANADCSEGSGWDLLQESLSGAIREVKNDLLQALNQYRESNVANYRGLIGKAESKTTYPVSGNIFGVQIRPRKRLKDAYWTIKAFHLGIDTAGDYEITISSNDNTWTPVSYTVTVSGDAWTRYELETPLQLPLYSIATSDLKYNITYSPGAARARVNKFTCCGVVFGWMSHLDAHGINAGALDDDYRYSGTTGHGLAIEGYFDCNKLDWICDLDELNGYEFKTVIARLIQAKGKIKIISRILDSGKINYFTLLQPEKMAADRQAAQEMYAEYMLWVVQNMPPNITSCWGCEKSGPRITKIIG